jgi:hypothetical protein
MPSTSILIAGKSGSGKSSSLYNCDTSDLLLINVLGKDLPFPGAKKKFTPFTGDKGNHFVSDNAAAIVKCLQHVSTNRKDIKKIVIDDAYYILGNEFISRAKEKGYEKFTEMASNFWWLLRETQSLRDDICVFVLTHTDLDEFGNTTIKTCGKMLAEKVNIPGMFTIIIEAVKEGVDEHFFYTRSNGQGLAKTPRGMFADTKIPNDINTLYNALEAYKKGE